jgi:hypothetical protein
MIRVFIDGIGVLGPGLPGWQASRAILAGAESYRSASMAVPACDLLPAAERRRTGAPVKLALAVGREAFADAGRDASITATVFTASCGDGENLHHMCESLAAPVREASPTRFHNSVHNAAAGYWGIAVRSHEPSTSLCCYDGSFAAGLLDAAAQAAMDAVTVALIAYDLPYPEPLRSLRQIGSTFGVALVLAPEATGRALAAVEIDCAQGPARPRAMADAGLEDLRAGNPAARSLPLLAALAGRRAEELALEYLDTTHLRVAVSPCR